MEYLANTIRQRIWNEEKKGLIAEEQIQNGRQYLDMYNLGYYSNVSNDILQQIAENESIRTIKTSDLEEIVKECHNENLEVVKVATVTDDDRLVMHYLGQTVVDIDRHFLDKNGASRHQNIYVSLPDFDKDVFENEVKDYFKKNSSNILLKLFKLCKPAS